MKVQGINSNGEPLRDAYVEHSVEPFFCSDDGVTRQEFADECDINVLLAQYERTGVLNHYNSLPPQYLDVSDVPDLAGALDMVERAQAAFMTLPAKVRKEFDNDPVQFMDYAADSGNLDRMREWGLAPPAPPPPSTTPSSQDPGKVKEEPPF